MKANPPALSMPLQDPANQSVIQSVLTVPPETSIEAAIAYMQENKDSCVLITDEQQHPVGIFTERDLVRLVGSAQLTLREPISTIMTRQVKTLQAEDINHAFSLFQQMQTLKVRHLPVVDAEGQAIGVVTKQSLRKALTPSTLLKLRLVQEVMETEVVCAPTNTSIRQIAQKMAEHSVSCVVITSALAESAAKITHGSATHRPVGIITERDIVQFQTLGLAFAKTEAQAVMSTPLLPVDPSDSLWQTHQQMNRHRVRRFVVCNGKGELAGLITQSSLLQALNPVEVQQMVELLQAEIEQLKTENQRLLEAQNHQLRQTQAVLSTELVQKQKEMQKADEKVRFQSSLLDMVEQSVIATDLAGQIIYWNHYSEKLYGWLAAEVIDRPVLEVIPYIDSQSDVGIQSETVQLMHRLQKGEAWSGEFAARRKDETYLPVWVVLSPIYDEQGSLVGIVGVSDDISDRKRREAEQQKAKTDLQFANTQLDQSNDLLEQRVASRTAELRQAEHRWRNLLENVQLLVVGIGIDRSVTYTNPFFLETTGYIATEVMDVDWFEWFVPPDERSHINDYFQQLINAPNETSLQYKNTILTKSGEPRIIVWNNTLLRDLQDNVIGSMSIGEDITERFAIETMKGEFVAMVSHELRTPLTAIHGGLKLLGQGIVPAQSEEGKRLLQVAAESSERLVRLVNDILDLERLESGKSPLNKKLLNTQEILRQEIDSFKIIASQKKIGLEVMDAGVTFVADRDRLHQVFTNLLANAIKFSPAQSTVVLTVEKELDTVLFKVCDQGIGISADQCDKIFERFVQGTHSNTNEKGGTGLGLTICQNIVEQHGGSIWVESTVGEGSCFYFRLPLGD